MYALTQEEVQMTIVEVMRVTQNVADNLNVKIGLEGT